VKGSVWEYLGVNVCSSTATHIVNCKVLNAIKLFTVGYLAEEFVKYYVNSELCYFQGGIKRYSVFFP
jgi:hypothetical protein